MSRDPKPELTWDPSPAEREAEAAYLTYEASPHALRNISEAELRHEGVRKTYKCKGCLKWIRCFASHSQFEKQKDGSYEMYIVCPGCGTKKVTGLGLDQDDVDRRKGYVHVRSTSTL